MNQINKKEFTSLDKSYKWPNEKLKIKAKNLRLKLVTFLSLLAEKYSEENYWN